mmetsp:Transcript_13672/g.20712  ORF Transcript_13672/g.20712 Transcript_13672/m.20712 type:complete len:303 (+) Transcript_13672:147-1055(+)
MPTARPTMDKQDSGMSVQDKDIRFKPIKSVDSMFDDCRFVSDKVNTIEKRWHASIQEKDTINKRFRSRTTSPDTHMNKDNICIDGYELRLPMLSDLPALRELHRELFPVQYKESFFQSLVTSRNTVFSLVAIDKSNNRLVGVCTARLKKQTFYKYFCYEYFTLRIGYIMTLGVTASHQRRGLASKMLHYMQWHMKESKGCHQVRLHCKVDNEKAIQFYKKANFIVAQKIKSYYHINRLEEDAYLLTYDMVPLHPLIHPPPANCCETIADVMCSTSASICNCSLYAFERCLSLFIDSPKNSKS